MLRLRTCVHYSVLLLVLAALVPTPAAAVGRPSGAQFSAVEATAAARLGRTNATVPKGRAPFYTEGSSWVTTEVQRWNAGFLPGGLWYEYQRSGETSWATAARSRQAGLKSLATYRGTPDIACILLNTYARAYRLTGDEHAKDVALAGASNLAGRYVGTIGAVRAHGTGDSFRTIVDQLMNTELLFWAADNGGDPAWRTMATRHALRTAADFQRPDGSTYHYVTYNVKSGAVLKKGTIAGASDRSTWSRGHAWFIYGMAAGYRETGDARLLAAARKATDYWVAHVPADGVPYWDFDDPAAPNCPRDSSAAAIAASAFVELSTLDPASTRRNTYLSLAEKTIGTLSSPEYLNSDSKSLAVLSHGTYYHPGGKQDHGTIWGDYFFREALMRLGSKVRRVDGPDRFAVAVRASQLRFPSSDCVVLASGEQYADALSSSSLAGVNHAPLLLTRQRTITSSTRAEVVRLGAKRVIIVGGRGTVGDEVVAALRRLPGVTVERISGADRYELSARVATRVLKDPASHGQVFVTRGDVFADALSVSPVAWANAAPVLLTRPSALPLSARAVLGGSNVTTVTVVGGEGSVSRHVAAEIGSLTHRAPQRIAGRNRYDTATAFATWATNTGLATSKAVGVATGANFPDALAGGSAIGSANGVILLTEGRRLTPATRAWLRSHRTDESAATIYGGPSSVSEPVEFAIDQVVTFDR